VVAQHLAEAVRRPVPFTDPSGNCAADQFVDAYGEVVLDREVDDGLGSCEVEDPRLGLHHGHRQVAAGGHEVHVLDQQPAVRVVTDRIVIGGGAERHPRVVGERAERCRLGPADRRNDGSEDRGRQHDGAQRHDGTASGGVVDTIHGTSRR
jgi:hypothetical protein